ncbi:hypothetical protein RB195_003844 [Necator americanus]|uniref:Uncharacterized protein n=1 Tax=Necator americanus TaxID=51031 RepID=A0ABR1DQI5_NECAM
MYFFENEAGQALTDAQYRDKITKFLMPELDEIDIQDMWFQQDAAICHRARETIQLLDERFPGRVISPFSVVDEKLLLIVLSASEDESSCVVCFGTDSLSIWHYRQRKFFASTRETSDPRQQIQRLPVSS